MNPSTPPAPPPVLRVGPIAAHAAVLVVADLAGLAGGAVAANRLLGADDQVWLQLPLAVGATVLLYSLARSALGAMPGHRLRLRTPGELGACLAASMAFGALLLVPAHFLSTGYLTGLGNVVAFALYQVPINAVALFLPAALGRSAPPSG